ncbi:hypothetical protein HMPREF3213_03820 [Heyndrickxia coagulans]|uniref:Uncharacterized protein n=1 Tax=Heyndrickxia coagulans TaxID=1398 RepID=A0A0C5C5L4_HEYCO|nr:hypothetical protein SB48_HM08orf02022 [Heyndrickxia coagulans]KWZ76450.1 hypothetical protein HMPREF3213_03820 [Heyndrickxia coagulans]
MKWFITIVLFHAGIFGSARNNNHFAFSSSLSRLSFTPFFETAYFKMQDILRKGGESQ